MKRKASSQGFKELESRINERLKAIDRRYAIRHLLQAPDGKFRFELSVAVDPRFKTALERVLREVLRELPADRQVQAKFYFPESLVKRIRKAAAKRGVSRSALVADCLSQHL